MAYRLVNDDVEEIPAGKRTVRKSIYGNLNGYVGRRFWSDFGDAWSYSAQQKAREFLGDEEVADRVLAGLKI